MDNLIQNFEKTGAFYLERLYNSEKQQINNDLVLYDSKDLTTHAVCVGMTGSGKAGCCLGHGRNPSRSRAARGT